MDELHTLVGRAQAGDLAAYDVIVRRFQDMAVGYAYSLLGDFHLAEDAAQEAFIEAYLDLNKLQEPAAFPGWFRQIVFGNCRRVTRKRREVAVALEDVPDVAADDERPDELLDERELRELVSRAYHLLPEHERSAAMLFYINQRSQGEIAHFLGLPTSTINNRLRSARKRLRKEFEKMTKNDIQGQLPSRDETFAARIQDELQAMELLHGELAPLLTPIFAAATERDVEVEIQAVDQTVYADYVRSIPEYSFTYYFFMEPMIGRVTLHLSVPLSLALLAPGATDDDVPAKAEIDRLLHQADVTPFNQPGRTLALSPSYIGVVNESMGRIIRELEAVWKPILQVKVSDVNVELSPVNLLADTRTTDPEEKVIRLLLEVKAAGLEGLILSMSYPVSMLEVALPRFKVQS